MGPTPDAASTRLLSSIRPGDRRSDQHEEQAALVEMLPRGHFVLVAPGLIGQQAQPKGQLQHAN